MGKRKGNDRVLRRLAAVALFLATVMGAVTPVHAGMNCTVPAQSITMTVPSGSFSVGRDAPVGTVLSPWTSFQGNNSAWSCSGNAGVSYTVRFSPGQVPSGTITPIGVSTGSAGNWAYFNTNIAGVGVIAISRGSVPAGVGSTVQIGTTTIRGTAWANSGAFTGALFGYGMQFAFVKTGPITGGTASAPTGPIVTTGPDTTATSGPSPLVTISLTGSATFSVSACQTPDVVVPMGNRFRSEFTGVGSGSTPVGFNIQLNSCPVGMKSIQYRIDPVTTVVNSTQSVVALDSNSTAGGVGVQLLNNAGTAAFPLQSLQVFSGYNSTTGGSYTIPFKARYYQTGTAVTGGSANTSMTFTMQYM